MNDNLQSDAHDWYYALQHKHGNRVARFLIRGQKLGTQFDKYSDGEAAVLVDEANQLYLLSTEEVQKLITKSNNVSDRTLFAVLFAVASISFLVFAVISFAAHDTQLHVFASRISLLAAAVYVGALGMRWISNT